MKKILWCFLLLMLLSMQICYAKELPKGTLSKEQLSLGHMSIGASPKDVMNRYGEPTRVDDRNGMTFFMETPYHLVFMEEVLLILGILQPRETMV